jgi:hypothetical protein
MNSLVVENKLKEILRSEKKLSMKCLIKVMSKAVVSFFFGSDAIYVWKIIWFISCVKSDFPVIPLFIFDADILDKLPKDDARVSFIHENLTNKPTVNCSWCFIMIKSKY